jgi:predicted dehydrogenase
MTRIRLGIIGAARIAPTAIMSASREVSGVDVVAVAARDGKRAEAFAATFGIKEAFQGYETLLDGTHLDAVYVALPASEHARWTLAALERGLHVLVEKPFTLNAEEATLVVDAGDAAGRIVAEAFHWRYHPLAPTMITLTEQLGTLRSASAILEVTNEDRSDIRWQVLLGGGALMDVGCYTVHWLRTALREEPIVAAAKAELVAPELDGAMEARLDFPSVAGATIRASMLSRRPPEEFVAQVEIIGERGFMKVENPLTPHSHHQIDYELDGQRRTFRVSPRSAYSLQLKAFRDAILHGEPLLTGGRDAIANMRVIDAIYEAAGLQPRGEFEQPAGLA